MKIRHLLAFFLLVSLISCSKEEELPRKVYYQFLAEDLNLLPEMPNANLLVFRNQHQQERTFEIYKVAQEKELHAKGIGFLGPHAAEYFFYDKKTYDMQVTWSYDFRRFPIDISEAEKDPYTLFPSKLYGQISFFPGWNGGYYIPIDFAASKEVMSIADKSYKDVVIFHSKIDTAVGNSNVKTIYYSIKKGVVGFDDLEGLKWRLAE